MRVNFSGQCRGPQSPTVGRKNFRGTNRMTIPGIVEALCCPRVVQSAWMLFHGLIVLTLLFPPLPLLAGSSTKKAVAVRTLVAPRIDGMLNEPEWQRAQPITDFLQRDPDEGKPPTEKTEIRILYDDEALYFGCRMYDREPSKMIARLARRDDEVESDFISIRIDSYHDHQTAFEFTINAAGVKVDILQYNDGRDEDPSWDPVWDVQTRIDDEAWIAEVKIPSQALRYSQQDEHEWGIQFIRRISRKKERIYWALVRRSESGFVSRFGHLVGISALPPPTRIEVIPFVLGNNRTANAAGGQARGSSLKSNAGLDLKYRPTGGLTIDATINPDFGQVEADPAVLNLSTFETFYPEKRPFFIEGAQILQFTTFGGRFGPGLFYSRRIGKALSPDVPDGGYVENEPRFASILGAVKLSGKTPGGLSIGAVEAVTQEESAVQVLSTGERRNVIVEPFANYSLLRIRQDVSENSNVGMVATSVSKKGRVPAFTGGTDWDLKFLKNEYRLDGFLALSSTAGTEGEARTGSAGRMTFNKEGGEHWRGALSADFTSKGFDINDIGFFRRPNDYGFVGQLMYREDTPADWYRLWNVRANYHYRKNFDKAELFNSIEIEGRLTFSNYWEVKLGSESNWGKYDDRETRGHGLYRKPEVESVRLEVETDSRQPVVGQAAVRIGGDDFTGSFVLFSSGLELRPASNLTLQFAFQYNQRRNERAWVDYGTVAPLLEPGNIFANRTTDEVDLTTRASFVFSRDLTLQTYFQFFSAKGRYDRFVRMIDSERFQRIAPGAYEKPDFARLSFNSNVVLRWEYLPGSTIFLVWSQARHGDGGSFSSTLDEDFRRTFTVPAENVFLFKLSYWWSL